MKRILLLMICATILIAGKAQAPTDSIGVYSVRGDTITRMEQIKYNNIEVSGGLFSAKGKLKFEGNTSLNQFKDKAVFRLYFGMPSPYEVQQYYMFTTQYSAKDFGVVKFKVKKDNRYIETTKISMFGSKVGAQKSEDIEYEVVKLRDNVYQVTVTGKPGEYCITPAINGMAGYAGVFDFTLL